MSVSRYPNGLTTASKAAPMGDFILPDFTKAHIFQEDFDKYVAGDWTVTKTGLATEALTDADGGRLLVTTTNVAGDNSFSQKVGESFLFETGKKLWFDCLFQTSDSSATDIVLGLQITDTTPLDVTDGVFFLKADGSTTVNLLVEKNNTATTTAVTTALASATDTRLSFYYDGKSSIKAFVDGVHVATSVTTNLPDDEVLTVSFGIQTGAAAAKTLTIDYIVAAKER